MGRVLLLVELKGGNDGLNTLVPYADQKYRELRPKIALPRERVLQLDERVGLHEKLEPLMASWKAGDLAIVQGVGYPFPNRSHFRSIEIWDTASSSSETLSVGWIAQVFNDAKLAKGVGVDCIVADTNALPSTGPSLRTIVMQDAENFLRQADARVSPSAASSTSNRAMQHLLALRQEINAAASWLRDRLRNAPALAEPYGQELLLGHQLDLATRILSSRVPVVAIKIALGGFDTHSNQPPKHERSLAYLASSLATLRRNLIAADCWKDVVVMTYSEFGRRLKQNASGGTDHGTSAPQFIMGGSVKGGLYGVYPSLSDLQDGDLRHTVDFRNVFATVAQGCWRQQYDFGLRRTEKLSFLA